MKQDTRLCMDCRYYNTIFHSAPSCTNKNFVNINIHTEEPFFYSCAVARSEEGKCKEEGLGFKLQSVEIVCYGDYSFTIPSCYGYWEYSALCPKSMYGSFTLGHTPCNRPEEHKEMLLGEEAFPEYKAWDALKELFRKFKSIIGK